MILIHFIHLSLNVKMHSVFLSWKQLMFVFKRRKAFSMLMCSMTSNNGYVLIILWSIEINSSMITLSSLR